MVTDDDLERDVKNAVRAARARGATSFHEVLGFCEGADPILVSRYYESDGGAPTEKSPATARRETSELAAMFPAADPVGCQWWFTLDTIEQLANRVYQIAPSGTSAAFLGAPTVAYQYSRRSSGATLFEVDKHVIEAISKSTQLKAVIYDVAESIPAEHCGAYSVILVDPPWYPEMLDAFISRALDLGADGASILCSLPPRLTRPSIVEERQNLLRSLLEADVEVVGIERSATRYLVPEFERIVLKNLPQFDGRPWRSGDLLHLRRKAQHSFKTKTIAAYETCSFARDAKRYRVFIRKNCLPNPKLIPWVDRFPEFEKTVSRRKVDPAGLHWWTSDKRGGTLRDAGLVHQALELWANPNLNLEEAKNKLIESGVSAETARSLYQDLDQNLGLWSTRSTGILRKRDDLAVTQAGSRPYPKGDDDGYRSQFQRDRDRITWSRGLRQLANKTQVFPLGNSDYLRNRLSHSLEVMQLASTIGTSFGLNSNLIEAGALAHDIGHTPFGHAGEDALNALFAQVKESLGFNHYEHGVDVVRWLEDAYQSSVFGGLFGLNLTAEVAECIFKHTYCHSGGKVCQSEIYRRSKHKTYFKNDLSHIEGQAVRIADKVSYLISDLEDGLRVGALRLADLLDCKLLRRPPIDLVLVPGESALERFLSQRSLLVGVLMEDIIEATAKRLESIGSINDVRQAKSYTVNHSDELTVEVDEVWRKLQVGKLHVDGRVRIANLKAARIVRELTLLFTAAPQLIDERFRESHERLHSTEYMEYYRKETGRSAKLHHEMFNFIVWDSGVALGFDPGKDPEVPIENLIQAKDFVAGLSDERARSLHHDFLGR